MDSRKDFGSFFELTIENVITELREQLKNVADNTDLFTEYQERKIESLKCFY